MGKFTRPMLYTWPAVVLMTKPVAKLVKQFRTCPNPNSGVVHDREHSRGIYI